MLPIHQYSLMLSVIMVLTLMSTTVLLATGQCVDDVCGKTGQEETQALQLVPDYENGKKVYSVCAVCHEPEGWGTRSGYYPQIAGQLRNVTIKQMADIRAGNRDNPTMLPFTQWDKLSTQDIVDVAAYLEHLPMNPDNGIGPGDNLQHGEELYRKYCTDCHGSQGEGIAADNMPLIQGQHYEYLVRQFEWIRNNKRRNADKEMVDQIEGFSESDIGAIMDYVSRMRPPAEKLAEPGWLNPDFPRFVRLNDEQSDDGSEL